jgi:hypothetical protein
MMTMRTTIGSALDASPARSIGGPGGATRTAFEDHGWTKVRHAHDHDREHRREEQAGQDAGNEELADGLLGEHAVDDEQQARRNEHS